MDENKPVAPFGELLVLGALAYNWMNTTHSSETGHDHHCQLTGLDPGDPALCSCGWSTFYAKYLEIERETDPAGAYGVPMPRVT